MANALFRVGDWPAARAVVDSALVTNPTGSSSIVLLLARCRLLVGTGQFDAAENDLGLVEILSAQTVGPRYQCLF